MRHEHNIVKLLYYYIHRINAKTNKYILGILLFNYKIYLMPYTVTRNINLSSSNLSN